ncbi:GIY-YIG nuclease family protein [Roseibium algicola]|uniref:GIY-YIG nuclease family protein n=1 Tax=Roseibium algicola TaxID=2857014 RepID=UPI0009878018|nr:GIY-YIG nuclease family protein [Roseibium aggregatum]
MTYYVYILASRMNGTLYIGVTNDLSRRVEEHRGGAGGDFTRKHGIGNLVFAEAFDDVSEASAMEKRLKKWRRSWKVQLIEKSNPEWHDLMAPYPRCHPGRAARDPGPTRLQSV